MTELASGSARQPELARTVGASVLPAIGAGVALFCFHAVGETFARGWLLDLGSMTVPAPREMMFFLFWAVFASLAAGLLAVALCRAYRSFAGVRARVDGLSAPRSATGFVAVASVLGFLVPALIRAFVLRDAPLSDDESPYRFMAELLATGRLRAPSPLLKLFYDRPFMVNDGHQYAMYFVGWPALMAPTIWLGIDRYANAVYSALTVPALFFSARRLAGTGWARLIVVVYLSAPMLMIGAATEMSHTSCLFALTWMGWFLLRNRDHDAPIWSHAGVAAAFGAAFFVRPSSALGAGLPVLVAWLWDLRRLSPAHRARALLAFAVPAMILTTLFLAVNHIQTGSALKPAYLREAEYARENQYRFSLWSVHRDYAETTPVVHFDFQRSPTAHVAYTGLALLRLNFGLLGWPFSLVFVLFAFRDPMGRVLTASFAGFCLVHLAVLNPGMDTFGPHHYFELAWPVLLLSALGLARARAGLGRLSPAAALYPAALALALVCVSVLQYSPVRLGAVAVIAERVNRARDALAASGVHHAVVFAPYPFPTRTMGCLWPRHFVFWRPHTDPDLKNDILWVNHVSVEENQKLLRTLPGRQGYVITWSDDCQPRFLPLEGLPPDAVPEEPQSRPRPPWRS
jgi:hypothetical protein